ncbi:MAG: hypothetical protein RLZ83_1028 [Pseudomonadota bacterium]|jgi:DNA-binding transcriptional LysR family regulator
MNLRQIEVFRAVMGAGSMTDAARLLHVSQPGISRLIRHLELQLGVTLFERRRGRIVPTPEARTLHAEIERVYRGVLQVHDVANHLRFGAEAPLRLLASANVALQLLPRAVAELVGRTPKLRVAFEMLPAHEITKRLVAEAADLAVSSAAPEHPALHAEVIGHWRLVCALPAAHRLAAEGAAFSLAAALAERLVLYGPEAPQSAAIEAWLDSHRIARNVAVEVRSGYAACAMAAAGAGIAFVDDLSARAHRPDGVVFKRIPRAPEFPVYLILNRHRPLSGTGHALRAIVQRELAALRRDGHQLN